MTQREKRYIDGLLARDERVTRELFYRLLRPMLQGIILNVFRGEADYDEVVSDLYCHLMEKDAHRLRSFGMVAEKEGREKDNITLLLGWLKRVVHNYYLNQGMKELPESKKERYVFNDDGELISIDIPDDTTESPQVKMDADTFVQMAGAERDKDVLRMAFLDGQSPEEIAAALGVSIELVYTIKSRALKRLKKKARFAKTPQSLCAIMCEQYALACYGVYRSLEELKQLSLERGWLDGEGMLREDMGKLCSHFGLLVCSGEADFVHLSDALSQEIPVVVALDGGELTGNLLEEKLEDILSGEWPDHCVAVLFYDESAQVVAVYDPICGTMPLWVSKKRFEDAWADSGHFMMTVPSHV